MRLWKKVALGAAGVAVLALGAHEVHRVAYHPVTAAERVSQHPMPPLFQQAAVAPYATQLGQQAAKATTLMQGWWRAHGTRSQDKEFVAWLGHTLPAPPSDVARKAEAKQLEPLAKTRTESGRTAARWLQEYGGRDLWMYYEHGQSAHLPKAQQKTRLRELKRLLRMAKKVDQSLNKQLAQPAPYLLDPALRQSTTTASTGKGGCPCSYPASVDADSAAGRTYLSYLYPAQAGLYKNMTDQLGYAQVYLGNHLPSDVDAGSLLGDMLGEYFLVTRGEGRLPQVEAAVARM